MSIIRVYKNKDYTIMSNFHLKDKRLSLKAKGLLSVMLSLPDDWEYSISGLAIYCDEKETTIVSSLHELKKFKYIIVDKLMPNQTKSGRIEYLYNIFEFPQEQDNQVVEEQQQEEKQGLEKQGLEKQGLVFYGLDILNNNNIIKEQITNIQNTNIQNTNINNKEKIYKKESIEILNYWNSKKIIMHKMNDEIETAIDKVLKNYNIEDIKSNIDRYSIVVSDDNYYFNTKWSLVQFLKQKNAMKDFQEDGTKWINYTNSKNYKNNVNTNIINNVVLDESWFKND